MAYTQGIVPAGGEKITIKGDSLKATGRLQVPDAPIIPFVEGDGTGRDIWRASVRVFDAVVEKAYGGKRKIHWRPGCPMKPCRPLPSSWWASKVR
jgi:isocitrate dehydrogenase